MRDKYNHQSACSCINCKTETTVPNLGRHYHKCTQILFPKPQIIKPTIDVVCKECGKTYQHSDKSNKFCSHSCAAKHTNKRRIANGYIISDETKSKIATGVSKYHKEHQKTKPIIRKIPKIKPIIRKLKELSICGPYTKIFLCTCKSCKTTFYYKSSKQYCETCRTKSSNLRSHYKFNFNIFDYPELFDVDLLSKVGFYGPGGKSKRWNIEGLSRDHKVSVSEAIKNNYLPYYISHPLNCELMPHRLNDKKKGKSSMTYSELVTLVDAFEISKMRDI